jgi:hypothetical protein
MTDQKVYIVTAGTHSDYGIVAVYLDEEAAYAYTAMRNGDHSYREFSVAEWDVATERTFSGEIWEANWKMNGPGNYYPNQEESWTRQVWHDGEDPGLASVVRTHADSYGGLLVEVHGTSKEHVEKTLYDTVAQFKAERAGL